MKGVLPAIPGTDGSQASELPVHILRTIPPGFFKEHSPISQVKTASDIGYFIQKTYKEREKPPEPDVADILREQSVKLPTEPRFKEMKHYAQIDHMASGHFARLTRNRKKAAAGEEVTDDHHISEDKKGDVDFDGIDVNIDAPQAKAIGDVENRLLWQQTFDRTTKRLLVDFDLSEVPTCRLNHLERMHSWFTAHGQKQTRKAKAAPSYIALDRKTLGAEMPAGSTMNFQTKPSSAAVELLAGASFTGRKRTAS